MSASMREPTAISRAMGPVARELLGEPSEETKDQLRFGTRGSMCVDLEKGTFFDHESDQGGGVLDLVMTSRAADRESALNWLRERGYVPKPSGLNIVKTYPYTDELGELVFEVCRLDPKDFRQRRPTSDGKWVWKTSGVRKLIYRLPATLAAIEAKSTIYITEGEKAADALVALGLAATCSPGGAKKWKTEHSDFMRGADAVVLPDNDEPGQEHAAIVVAGLKSVAARVRVLNLPNLPPKGDAFDWIAAGGTADQLAELTSNTLSPANIVPPKQERPGTFDHEAAILEVLERFNRLYLLVNEGGKAVIFQPSFDPILKRKSYNRLSVNDLRTLYLNERVQVGIDDKEKPVFRGAADVWLRHPERRQYIHGVIFDPACGKRPGVLNTWEGYAVRPAAGDWSLLRRHVHQVICAGDPIRFNYLMGWMARLLQRPAEQGEVAVVMRGGEGVGKGTLANALKRIIGHHALSIANGKHLVGNFNAHLRDTVFLFADEAFFAGDRAHVGVLKSIITEPSLTVEAKFANTVESPNYLHLMMASNEEWVVPAALDARRFFVLEVTDAVKNDHAYFGAIWKQMDAGGYAAMLHDLLNYDLSTFNVRAVPTTAGLQHQRKLSLPTTEAWWLDCLERGYVFRSRLGLEAEFAMWHPTISMELLFDSYTDFAKAKNERRILSRELLGRFFKSLKAEPLRWRNGTVGEHVVDEANLHGGSSRKSKLVTQDRVTGYCFGNLQRARTDFIIATGLNIEWDHGAPEDGGE